MGNGNMPPPPDAAALQDAIENRKEWFLECQLRWLNLASFRDISAKSTDILLELIDAYSDMFNSPVLRTGLQIKKLDPVYVDSLQPVWTDEVRQQKDFFVAGQLGNMGDLLGFKQPVQLAARLAELKEEFEQSRFGSGAEETRINRFFRRDNKLDTLTHAICRGAIAEKKPWLIPEIFHMPRDPLLSEAEQWIKNAWAFIDNYEHELNEVVGGGNNFQDGFSLADPERYRNQLRLVMQYSISRRSENTIKTTFVNRSADPWKFNIKIDTPAYRYNDLEHYPSDSVKYWISTVASEPRDKGINTLRDILVNKHDSDMQVCLVMRALYLFGTLPDPFKKYEEFNWRNRQKPGEDFSDFFAEKARQIGNNPLWQGYLVVIEKKLRIILEETADSPCSAAALFSPIAEQIIKWDLLGYKFWLDESFKAYDNSGKPGDADQLSDFCRARVDLLGLKEDEREEAFAEMEYWSENHYIMFASSEFLAGQLWPHETFEPAQYFLKTTDNYNGKLTGTERMNRGRARVLKWLNNKLMYGWMEFNSSGYYREHLYALLNLVDFSLDKEIHCKATVVTDLLLFDAIRFSHKGSTGAAGGRCQFKSKHCGWDSSLCDVLEIILGERGIFVDKSAEIGSFFSTSTYKVPDALVRIGHLPPGFSFTDRSRVSISFEEAPKWGIDYSQRSDQRDSFYNGFAPKRSKHFPYLAKVNQLIADTHKDYGAWQDDTVFWWGLSAFYNHQVIKNTLACVDLYQLHKNKIFDGFLKIVLKYLAPVLERSTRGLTGGVIGSALAGATAVAGAVAGFYGSTITGDSMIEAGADTLSLVLDGSTRTRANILTYRNRDVMLSSVQNFRAGQFNFQSNVNQATLSSSVNVFTTAAFSGIDLPGAEIALLSGVIGGFITQGPIGALAGVGVGILADKFVDDQHLLFEDEDGPSWWTGYWSLPMIVQHENAAIIAYDYSAVQKQLADSHSHVWFPTSGFDETQRRRSSAYTDDNFFLWDITSIGPKGYWLFGKIVHPKKDPGSLENEEGYIGVFSNQEPRWLDKDSDFYQYRIDNAKDEGKNGKKLQSDPIWDYFADKDWSVDGKNIWIMQVGSNLDFGSFENFKERVSSARVLVDDTGDMECSYDIPQKDGSSRRLSLKYKDDGAFSLDGQPFETDLYPRFENPFVRGGRVEWGQREYVIEFGGNSLLHDFSDMEHPRRIENILPSPDEAETVKALVIYLKTEDEEMEVHTVATASVNIGCRQVATDEVVAAGKVNENSFHDAEWIFFDEAALADPDMTINIYHNLARDIPWNQDGDTKWKMTFRLKALMGDRSLKPCSIRPLPLGKFYLRHKNRYTGAVPFSIQLSAWRKWTMLAAPSRMNDWLIAQQPGKDSFYFDYVDMFSLDEARVLSHRRLGPCGAASRPVNLSGPDEQIKLTPLDSFFPYATRPGYLYVFLVSQGIFYGRWMGTGQDWSSQSWTKLIPSYRPMKQVVPGIMITDHDTPAMPVPLGSISRVYASFIDYGTVTPAVYLEGADGNIYATFRWPLDGEGNWRKIETAAVFTPSPVIPFQIAGGFLFVADKNHLLWRYPVSSATEDVAASWELLLPGAFVMQHFEVAAFDGIQQVIARSSEGAIWALRTDTPPELRQWQRIDQHNGFSISTEATISCVSAVTGHLDVFATGTNGQVYTIKWTEATGWQNASGWNAVAADGQPFKASGKARLQTISRVNGQIEIYVTDLTKRVWKNWWS